MEDFRCDSLDAGSEYDRKAAAPVRHLTFDPECEASPAELAQCEAEVGTLLSIIAEVNKKMGSLKAPSQSGDQRSSGPPSPLFPDLLSHRLLRSHPEKKMTCDVTSKSPLTIQGGSGVVWTKLQDALSAVEDSISSRRLWAAPITSSEQEKPKKHLRAAEDSWTKATQILQEMEKEFGISCTSGQPKEECREELDPVQRSPSKMQQVEVELVPSSFGAVEEEKNKLPSHQRAPRSGSCSPSCRPSGSPGALGPDRGSPSFPGSPLFLRRASRAAAPSPLGGDASPLSSGNPGPCPVAMETETERLHRYIERLKAKNERLAAALERRRAESERFGAKVKRLEADCAALQLALKYCEECEEAFVELLWLHDAERQPSVPPAEEADDGKPSAQLGEMETEELTTSFSTAGVTEETEQRSPEFSEREVVLRQQIEHLRRDRAAICLPKPSAGPAEGRADPDGAKDSAKSSDGKREKASLFYELVSVREEMSELRALIRLKEKELRCLEWGLMAQKTQEAAGAFVPESDQGLGESAAKLCHDGDAAGPRGRPILKELQSVLQREQALKKRLALVHDSLNTALSDGAPGRRENEDQIARLTQAHSKALNSYRHIRRKYREQVWRLEQRVAAVMESQSAVSAGESLDWKREETVL